MTLQQNELNCKLIVDVQEPIIGLQFDPSGNFLFVLTQSAFLAFSYFEMRQCAQIELILKNRHVNELVTDYFSGLQQRQMKEANESVFKENATPTCFAIDETGSCCIVGFDDGDLVVFDIF